MSRRVAADWLICTAVLMLAYACRGWILAHLLQGRYPWTALLVDVVGLALVVAVFRLVDLAVRLFFERVLKRRERNSAAASAMTPQSAPARWRLAANILRFCIVFGLAAPVMLTLAQVHPQRIACATPPSAIGLEYEEVVLPCDGLNLSAWFIPSTQKAAAPVVFIAHGIGANKQNFLSVAEQIHHWGYHVFMLDFRAHGDSDGFLCTLGMKEASDVKAACDWIANRVPGQPIYGLAYSMGGVAVVRACAEHGLCERIALDCTFARLENSFRQTLGRFCLPQPLVSVGWHACRCCGWCITGIDPDEMQTEYEIKRLNNPRLLLIHGTKDQTSPYTESLRLAEQLNGQAEVWLVEGAGHLQSLGHPEYLTRLKRFFAGKGPSDAATD